MKFHDVTLQREVDLRYSMQVTELATPVPDGEFSERTGEEILQRFEEQYERINGSGAGYREAGVQAITYRVRAKAGLGFPVVLPEVPESDGPDPAAALLGERSVCLDSQIGFETTPSTTTPGCARAMSSSDRRSSRCRPRWSWSPPGSPAASTASATSC